MTHKIASIPRPLVRTNQTIIVLSVFISWILGIWTEQFYWILLIPFLSGLSGLLFGVNPIFLIARKFLKQSPSSYVQEDAADQRFNQIIATTLLGAAFISFVAGFSLAGYIFSAFVFTAALIALFGFCVGCYIRYQFLKRRAERKAG